MKAILITIASVLTLASCGSSGQNRYQMEVSDGTVYILDGREGSLFRVNYVGWFNAGSVDSVPNEGDTKTMQNPED